MTHTHTHAFALSAGDSWGWKRDVYIQRSGEQAAQGETWVIVVVALNTQNPNDMKTEMQSVPPSSRPSPDSPSSLQTSYQCRPLQPALPQPVLTSFLTQMKVCPICSVIVNLLRTTIMIKECHNKPHCMT